MNKIPQNNSCDKVKNEPFGHTIQNKPIYTIRIYFQNVDELELSNIGYTLEETRNVIQKYYINIACLAETNTNWTRPKSRQQLYKTIR